MVVKRLQPLVAAFCILIYACSPPNNEQPSTCTPLLPLARPIILQPDSTVIYLNDFLIDTPGNTLAIFRGDTLRVDADTHTVTIKEAPSEAIDNIRLIVNDCTYDIPVFKSEKITYDFVFNPYSDCESVALAGSFNGWNDKATPLTFDGHVWTTTLTLSPAEWDYQVVVDGHWMLDPGNPHKRENGQGGYNSVLTIGTTNATRPTIRAVSTPENELFIEGPTGATVMVWWENRWLETTVIGREPLNIVNVTLPPAAYTQKRSHLRAYVFYGDQRGNDVLVPLDYGRAIKDPKDLTRTDAHTINMYFVLIDRFADGDTSNNFAVDHPEIMPVANHQGGDFKGLLDQVNRGYFDYLGVNTIWVSPITTNAEGAWGLWEKGVRSRFSGYHGYWPVRSREIDRNFGDSALFANLIDALHQRNMNLLVDYVANHVHQDHPVIAAHPDWVTPLYLPDGSLNTERWDEYRLTTWFDKHLPTLDLEQAHITEAMTDTAMFWIENFAIDGFRHDATKHIPEVFWRTLTRKIKRHIAATDPDRFIFQIGETYGNPELIGQYLTSGMLDAQFDFNLYDAAVDALARKGAGFENLARVINESLHAYGHHHLMGNISGNQDRARFISYADGSVGFDEDAKLAGWTRTIDNRNRDGFERLMMLHALNMTLPGVPCLYYGDEIGLPGGNDPDNRRMMVFQKYTPDQRQTLDLFSQLAHLRNDRMSLLYGSTRIVEANADRLVIERTYLSEKTVLTLGYQGEVDVPDGMQLLSTNGRFTNGKVSFDAPGYVMYGRSLE